MLFKYQEKPEELQHSKGAYLVCFDLFSDKTFKLAVKRFNANVGYNGLMMTAMNDVSQQLISSFL